MVPPIAPHPATLPDVELLARTSAKDRECFLALYDRFSAKLLAIIRSIVRDAQASEDVHQDVWLEVWNRHAARYNVVLGPVDCWLIRLARSRAIDHVRSRAVRTAASMDDVAAGLPEAWRHPFSSDASAPVRDALRELPDDERLPVLLAYAHGMSREEIARQLNIPVGTVKTRIRRGIESLRHHLHEGGLVPS